MDKEQSKRFVERIFDFIEKSKLLQSVRNGFVMIIPILFIGSFSVIFMSLPIDVYQNFINEFCNGVLNKLFVFVNNSTMGLLSIYLTISIAICYSNQLQVYGKFNYGPTFTSLISFGILSGFLQSDFNMSALGTQGVFTAIVSALGATALYCFLEKRIKTSFKIYADGIDNEFNQSVSIVLPMSLVVVIFTIFNLVFVQAFNVTGFQMFFSKTMNHLFVDMGRSLGSMLLFAFLTSVLWLFGIHGSNVLEPVCQEFFVPAIDINSELVEAGEKATEIFSKTFYDCFALMGGSGTATCLVIAILIFSKRRSNKDLARVASVPLIFNVNEIVVFGLPVVFNPIMVIPFIVTPLALILVSTFAMNIGLVPIPIHAVEWTTPVILSGYVATGSITGSILQVVNITIGVLIYAPFIKMYDAEKNRDAKRKLNKLVDIFKEAESEDSHIELLKLRKQEGGVARSIAEEMKYLMERELPTLYYQPQFDNNRKCIGVEALLRWNHETYGMLYPPLVVKLAEEAGLLSTLEQKIFEAVIKDIPAIQESIGEEVKVSINVTGITIQTEEFEQFLLRLKKNYPDYYKLICIEITEQAAIKFDRKLIERLTRIHNMGYELAIDDFSMGSTSIKYLETNLFDLVKLDGGISKNVISNSRSKDIVNSITKLTENFGIKVLAEYVENEEQRKILEDIGCYLYQGYLYSPAVPVEKLLEL